MGRVQFIPFSGSRWHSVVRPQTSRTAGAKQDKDHSAHRHEPGAPRLTQGGIPGFSLDFPTSTEALGCACREVFPLPAALAFSSCIIAAYFSAHSPKSPRQSRTCMLHGAPSSQHHHPGTKELAPFPCQTQSWDGGPTTGRRRRAIKKLEKKLFAKITAGENPARSSQKQKGPMPQALGCWVQPLGLRERQRETRCPKKAGKDQGLSQAPLSRGLHPSTLAPVMQAQDRGFRWYLQGEVEPPKHGGPPPPADLSTRRSTAFAAQFIILRFETIQEGCRCLQEERERGGGREEGSPATAGLLSGCHLLETARPRMLLKALKLIWGRTEQKGVKFPPDLHWDGKDALMSTFIHG